MSVHVAPKKNISIATKTNTDIESIPQTNETLSMAAFEYARNLDISDPEKVPFYEDVYKRFRKYTVVKDYQNFRWVKDFAETLPFVGRHIANFREQKTDSKGHCIAKKLGALSLLLSILLCLTGYGLTKVITQFADKNSAFGMFIQAMAETATMGHSSTAAVAGVLTSIAIALACIQTFGLYLITVGFGIYTERSVKLEAITLARYESLANFSSHNAWLFEYYANQLRKSAASRGPKFSGAGIIYLTNSSHNNSPTETTNTINNFNQNDSAFLHRIEKILVNNYRMPASVAANAALGITIETGAYTGLILSLLKSHNIPTEWQERYGFNPRYCYAKQACQTSHGVARDARTL